MRAAVVCREEEDVARARAALRARRQAREVLGRAAVAPGAHVVHEVRAAAARRLEAGRDARVVVAEVAE